jgi:hypothetical protein
LVLALIMGLALVVFTSFPVWANESVDLEISGEGATSWDIGNVKPGDSGTKTVELHNAGSGKGSVTIWISSIEEVDSGGDGATLDDYLRFNLSCARLGTNITLPATIYELPQAAADANYIRVGPLYSGETVTLIWEWEFLETGQPQNDAQGDSLSFNVNYMLEELPSSSGGSDFGVPTYGLEIDFSGMTRTLSVTHSDNTLFRTYVIFDPDSSYGLTFERGTRVICDSGCSSCIGAVPSKLTVSPFRKSLPLPDGQAIVGPAYDLTGYLGSERCQGVNCDPPVELVWKYDPARLREGINEEDMVFALYDEDSNEWSPLDFVIDPVEHSITAEASHFSVFAVLGFVPPPLSSVAEVSNPPAVPTPGVTSPPPSVPPSVQPKKVQQSGINWPVLGTILGVAVFLAVFLWVRLRGRRARHNTLGRLHSRVRGGWG